MAYIWNDLSDYSPENNTEPGYRLKKAIRAHQLAYQYDDKPNRSMACIVYMFVAICGAAVGFLIGKIS